MKNLNEYFVESVITSNNDKIKDLIARVLFKYKIKSNKSSVIEAVNQICNMCKEWKVPYPSIHDFIYDEDEFEKTQEQYSHSELRNIFIDYELLCVEINGYGYYKWNNANKKWIKYY